MSDGADERMVRWMDENMVEPAMDDGWVYVDTHDDETLLRQAWSDLPFDIPYHEFRAKMLELKRHHQRGSFTRATLWTLETVWSLSGYATTLLTSRGYQTLLVRLLVWAIKG